MHVILKNLYEILDLREWVIQMTLNEATIVQLRQDFAAHKKHIEAPGL